jgi:hypothetical protein
MNGRDNPDKEVERDQVASLQTSSERLWPDTCGANLTLGVIGKRVLDVVRELAMDADGL